MRKQKTTEIAPGVEPSYVSTVATIHHSPGYIPEMTVTGIALPGESTCGLPIGDTGLRCTLPDSHEHACCYESEALRRKYRPSANIDLQAQLDDIEKMVQALLMVIPGAWQLYAETEKEWKTSGKQYRVPPSVPLEVPAPPSDQ